MVGLDNLSDYYDVELKKARLSLLSDQDCFRFLKQDISEQAKMDRLFRDEEFDAVVHLAAQAGVRHSLKHPFVYVDSNLKGFTAILEGCRHTEVGPPRVCLVVIRIWSEYTAAVLRKTLGRSPGKPLWCDKEGE